MAKVRERDILVNLDINADLDNFKQALEMFGPSTMQEDNEIRFFLGKALQFISNNVGSVSVLDSVVTRVKHELEKEDDQENRDRVIMDEWSMLANCIKDQLHPYLYEHGVRNKKVATFQGLMGTGLVSVIIHENEDEL